jgi:hypothetical protein
MIGAVCYCTRGLNYTRSIDAIWKALTGQRDHWELIPSWDLPIPKAQNYVTEEALKLGVEWLWYVEEDNVPDEHWLNNAMLTIGAQVVVADYKLFNGVATHLNLDGSVKFGGMGCLLVHSSVFDKMTRPFFKCNAYTSEGGQLGIERGYGGQDVHFFMECKRLGIEVIPYGKCAHLRLDHPGELKTNKGIHRISAL